MTFLKILYPVVSLCALAASYYLMAIRKGSPQHKLGKAFKMPDVRLHYTPELLYNTFEEAGGAGRPQMRLYWLYDFGLIAGLLGVMLAVSANLVSGYIWAYLPMVWLTIGRTLADLLEDALFLSLLRRYPAQSRGLAKLAAGTTAAKHLLLAAWLLLLFITLFLNAFGIA